MTGEREIGRFGDHEWLDDLERVQYDVFLELQDHDVEDQLVDVTPDAEHQRCVYFIKKKYGELFCEIPHQSDWPELSVDGRGEANIALIAANLYRIEKEFQESLVTDAVATRRILEKLDEQVNDGLELDQNFVWTTLHNKKQLQILFDLYYGKELSDPWQTFYHSVTEQLPPVDYTDPDDVAAFATAQGGLWHFEEICAAHNMILREAAEEAGLFRIQDDPESILRLVTILVETQCIAMRDRERGIESGDILRYGSEHKVGDRLIGVLNSLYSKRYFQD